MFLGGLSLSASVIESRKAKNASHIYGQISALAPTHGSPRLNVPYSHVKRSALRQPPRRAVKRRNKGIAPYALSLPVE